jgi:hypothetical protein
VSNWALRAFACFCAPCFIFTKNGFVSVFVIRPTLIVACGDEVRADATVAATAAVATTRTAAARIAARRGRRALCG